MYHKQLKERELIIEIKLQNGEIKRKKKREKDVLQLDYLVEQHIIIKSAKVRNREHAH